MAEPMTMDLAPAGSGVIVKAEPTLNEILHEAVIRGANVDVIERLVSLKERVEESAARKAFNEAKSRLHAKLPQIEKDGTIVVPARDGKSGHKSRYAKYEDIDLIIRPMMDEEGFSLEFDAPDATADALTMTCTLKHKLGHQETKRLRVPIDKTGSKNATQAIGSTVSYGRRYLLEMQLNIVTREQDDDGNGGGHETITKDQQDTITTLIRDTAANTAKVCEFAGADSLANIRQADFKRVVDALNRRKK